MSSKRDWRLLLAASAVSTVGDGACLAGLALLAASITTDPRRVAAVTACGTLPWLLTVLGSGALVDRTDARRTLVRTSLLQLVLVAALASITAAGLASIAVLCGAAFALGSAQTVAKVAAQKLVPAVVPADDLERANGQQNAVLFAAMYFVGPPLGALLFTRGTTLPLWTDAASFAVSAILVGRIAARTDIVATKARIADGFRWLAGHRLLRTLSLLSGIANLANYLTLSTLVLFARQRLGLDEVGYGVLTALMAVGGIGGGLLSGRIVARFGARATVTTTIFTTPLAMLGIGLFASNLATAVALASVTSFGAALWNVAVGSLRQRAVPPELLGRVSSIGLLVAWGAQPLGALLGGAVAGAFGLAAPWLAGGAIRLTAALAAMRTLRRPWPAAQSGSRPPGTAAGRLPGAAAGRPPCAAAGRPISVASDRPDLLRERIDGRVGQ